METCTRQDGPATALLCGTLFPVREKPLQNSVNSGQRPADLDGDVTGAETFPEQGHDAVFIRLWNAGLCHQDGLPGFFTG